MRIAKTVPGSGSTESHDTPVLFLDAAHINAITIAKTEAPQHIQIGGPISFKISFSGCIDDLPKVYFWIIGIGKHKHLKNVAYSYVNNGEIIHIISFFNEPIVC